MSRLNKLDVFYHDRPVGTMALYQNRLAAFEYTDDWIRLKGCLVYLRIVCRMDGDGYW